MADSAGVGIQREVSERIGYRQALERIADFVENELGNKDVPRQRPDIREWRKQRAQTIRVLKEFKEKLDAVCVRSKFGNLVGLILEILGAVNAVIGAFMSLFGDTSGPKVTNIGNLMLLTGTCIDKASTTIESLVTEQYLKNIETVLKEDQELSQSLAKWLSFSNELNIDMQEIFGVSLTSGTFDIAVRFFQKIIEFSSHVKSFDSVMKLMKQERYSLYIGNEVKVEKLKKFYQHLNASPQFVIKMRRILSILRAQPQHIQLVAELVQTYHTFQDMPSSSVLPTLKSDVKNETPTSGEVSVFCFFQAISLANSFISLTNANSIIKRGTSKYSDALEQITHSLACELKEMEDL